MSKLSIVNPEIIRKHPANTSPSKLAYQFSKSQRFSPENPNCPIAYYAYDSQLSNRKTSIGYGKKLDFTKSSVESPSPTLYKHKSLFEEAKEKNKGKTFGLSRDKSPDNSYLIPQLQKFPAPGKYQNQFNTKMTISYTARPKTIDVINKNLTWRKAPGPGAYEVTDLQPKSGRFLFSKFGDSKLAKVTNLADRFPYPKQSPGPLSYKEGDSLSNSGKYLLSHHKGKGTRPFDKTLRTHFTQDFSRNKSSNPGPGKYQKPSDFGVYGDAKFYKTLSTMKPTIE